eukprot:COSAG01_NODE_13227_length_1617_cov_1.351779_2_plen_210_part_00
MRPLPTIVISGMLLLLLLCAAAPHTASCILDEIYVRVVSPTAVFNIDMKEGEPMARPLAELVEEMGGPGARKSRHNAHRRGRDRNIPGAATGGHDGGDGGRDHQLRAALAHRVTRLGANLAQCSLCLVPVFLPRPARPPVHSVARLSPRQARRDSTFHKVQSIKCQSSVGSQTAPITSMLPTRLASLCSTGQSTTGLRWLGFSSSARTG